MHCAAHRAIKGYSITEIASMHHNSILDGLGWSFIALQHQHHTAKCMLCLFMNNWRYLGRLLSLPIGWCITLDSLGTMSVIHTHNIYIVHIQAKRSEHKFSVFVHANNAVESNRAGPKVNPLSLLEVWINRDNFNLLKT